MQMGALDAKAKEAKKALIQVLDERGKPKGEAIPVLFYPSEYTLTRTNNFGTSKIVGQAPGVQYTGRELDSLTMDLFFDTYEKNEDVRTHTKKITNLMEVDFDLHAPPVVRFIWGNLNFTCVITTITKQFTMFRSDGVPVRAKLTVAFQEIPEKTGSKKKLHSSDKTKIYTVLEGDSLWRIAAREYGDASMWRPIAVANSLENPRLLESGLELKIPPLED